MSTLRRKGEKPSELRDRVNKLIAKNKLEAIIKAECRGRTVVLLDIKANRVCRIDDMRASEFAMTMADYMYEGS